MNKQQRKELSELAIHIEEIKTQIDRVKDEEQDKYDNMPESLQCSDKGEALNNAINALDEAADACESAVSSLESAQE